MDAYTNSWMYILLFFLLIRLYFFVGFTIYFFFIEFISMTLVNKIM